DLRFADHGRGTVVRPAAALVRALGLDLADGGGRRRRKAVNLDAGTGGKDTVLLLELGAGGRGVAHAAHDPFAHQAGREAVDAAVDFELVGRRGRRAGRGGGRRRRTRAVAGRAAFQLT